MSYIPHTDVERQQMLSAIGVPTIEDLFEAVPAAYRFPKLDLPPALSEMEVLADLQSLAEANDSAYDFSLFRGAGAYHHYTPAAVNHMLLRGEFYTAYTPYQPEVSQGTLQAIFEYQTMIAQLTGMDGANASHYDGATSLAEAVTVALEASRRKKTKVILSPYINPQYRAVARTYHQGNHVTFVGDEGAAERSTIWSTCWTTTPPCSRSPIPTSWGKSKIFADWRIKSTRRARCSCSSPTRWRWRCSRAPANSARTSWSATVSRSAFR